MLTLLCTGLRALNNNETQMNGLAKDTYMYFSVIWQCYCLILKLLGQECVVTEKGACSKHLEYL